MRVLFDSQAFWQQRRGGISRYFSQLFNQLEKYDCIEWGVPLDFSHNEHIQELEKNIGPLSRCSRFLGGVNFKGKGTIFKTLNAIYRRQPEQQRTLQLLCEGNIELFHPTYYDDYFLSEIQNIPFVITVYDMIHELFSAELHDPVTVARKKHLVQKAHRVIAISDNTRSDLIRLTGVDRGKVDVVPHAGSVTNLGKVSSKLDKPEKYMLFVGRRRGYKNFARLFRAVAPLLQQDKALYLVCIGGENPTNPTGPARSLVIEENRLFDKAGVTDRVLRRNADDNELASWYQGATCLVFPSLYEGFGLPIVEAFYNHCPVAASNISSLPEVGGKAVAYFDPESIDSMRDTVTELLRSDELRNHLIKCGQERVKLFSWQRTARETLDVYRTALGRSREQDKV